MQQQEREQEVLEREVRELASRKERPPVSLPATAVAPATPPGLPDREADVLCRSFGLGPDQLAGVRMFRESGRIAALTSATAARINPHISNEELLAVNGAQNVGPWGALSTDTVDSASNILGGCEITVAAGVHITRSDVTQSCLEYSVGNRDASAPTRDALMRGAAITAGLTTSMKAVVVSHRHHFIVVRTTNAGGTATFSIYCPCRGAEASDYDSIRAALVAENAAALSAAGLPPPTSVRFEYIVVGPRQKDSVSCGAYCIAYMLFWILHGRGPTEADYNHDDASALRLLTTYIIVSRSIPTGSGAPAAVAPSFAAPLHTALVELSGEQAKVDAGAQEALAARRAVIKTFKMPTGFCECFERADFCSCSRPSAPVPRKGMEPCTCLGAGKPACVCPRSEVVPALTRGEGIPHAPTALMKKILGDLPALVAEQCAIIAAAGTGPPDTHINARARVRAAAAAEAVLPAPAAASAPPSSSPAARGIGSAVGPLPAVRAAAPTTAPLSPSAAVPKTVASASSALVSVQPAQEASATDRAAPITFCGCGSRSSLGICDEPNCRLGVSSAPAPAVSALAAQAPGNLMGSADTSPASASVSQTAGPSLPPGVAIFSCASPARPARASAPAGDTAVLAPLSSPAAFFSPHASNALSPSSSESSPVAALLLPSRGGRSSKTLSTQPGMAVSRARSADGTPAAGGGGPSAPPASCPSTRVTRQTLARSLSASAAPPSSILRPSQADRIKALHKGAAESSARSASEK